MKTNLRLEYYSSRHIQEFVTRFPVDWCDDRKYLANRVGCLADLCGRPPVPSMLVFFQTVIGHGLITQDQMWIASLEEWGQDFPPETCEARKRGYSKAKCLEALQVKCFRNFYSSAIDSLHVFALLVECRVAGRCTLDCAQDVCSATDLIVESYNHHFTIALVAGSSSGQNSLNHKRSHRQAKPCDFTLPLPMDRPKTPGNKRWYNPDDLKPIRDAVLALSLRAG